MVANLDIDLILISLFLLSSLALGSWYNRKQASGGDHILDSRNFTTNAITLTLIATFISIGTFNVRVHQWYNVATISFSKHNVHIIFSLYAGTNNV